MTRGSGRLEGFLARERVKKADGLVLASLRKGRVLDIGCGFFPYFLTRTDFSQKYGLDKGIDKELKAELKKRHDLVLVDVDLEYSARIPFDTEFFEVVTMLAVLEHMEPRKVLRIFQEIERILKPGGVFIITTPAKWTKGLLKYLARINMVSAVEIEEHKAAYSRKQVVAILKEAGFHRSSIRSGYFELFMNIWVRAKKEPNLFELEEFEPLES
ncbi:MAG: class I SAM-dependent methyltransferase [Syntrophorhabdaceae bacterium]|nr:class I SAM-dependent methyltransferase [Syntrophorhabdaceae bacterium]